MKCCSLLIVVRKDQNRHRSRGGEAVGGRSADEESCRNATSGHPARGIISKRGGFVMPHLIMGHAVSSCFGTKLARNAECRCQWPLPVNSASSCTLSLAVYFDRFARQWL